MYYHYDRVFPPRCSRKIVSAGKTRCSNRVTKNENEFFTIENSIGDADVLTGGRAVGGCEELYGSVLRIDV